MNGFAPTEVRASKITSVPEEVQASYERSEKQEWPGYVYGRDFFRNLGAEFRTVDDKEEMLLSDVVYSVNDYAPCGIWRERAIATRALSDLIVSPIVV
jgi:hypothetical protein